MRSLKVLAAAGALLAAAGLALVSGGSAHAAVSYADTSVQVTGFQPSTYLTTGAIDATTSTIGLTFTSAGSCSLSEWAWLTDPDDLVLSGTTLSASPSSSAGSYTAVTRVTDSCHDVSVLTIGLSVTAPVPPATLDSVQLAPGTTSVTGDSVRFSSPLATDDNTTGGIAFHATTSSTLTSYSASNLPAGLSSPSGTGELLPGSAVPGRYSSVAVSVTDSAGSVANGTVTLIVAGHPARVSSAAPPGPVTNFLSGKCLDNTGYTWADGNGLQQWRCNGGPDQNFQFTDGQLRAIAPPGKPQGPWCVTALTGSNSDPRQLAIETCGDGTGYQQVTFHGNVYSFSGTGTVMDDKGQSRSNGALVIGYPPNGGRNQSWSAP